MNKIFAEHVTSTAFFLSISKRQIEMLLHLDAYPHRMDGNSEQPYYREMVRGGGIHHPDNWIATSRALHSKGLTQRVIHDPLKQHGHEALTEAGKLVCALLREAGFSAAVKDERVAA